MYPSRTILLFLSSLLLFASTLLANPPQPKPNIVYILCDDLGYGDVHALNPERGKIPTPNIDRLITQGITFTDCHGGSSVCTPTRYGILTGRYAWRTRLQKGVLGGMGEPLIAPDRLTVPTLLKRHGYATAALGKWHLGLRFGNEKWTDPIQDGPLQHGFDTFFGISASLDMPPFAYIENDCFTQPPTVTKKWVRAGPAAKDFDAVNVVPDLVRKADAYIGSHANGAQSGHPFFLYLALTSPHTPLVPTKEFQGKSPLGPYGDFVMETDWSPAGLSGSSPARTAIRSSASPTCSRPARTCSETSCRTTRARTRSASFRPFSAPIKPRSARRSFITPSTACSRFGRRTGSWNCAPAPADGSNPRKPPPSNKACRRSSFTTWPTTSASSGTSNPPIRTRFSDSPS
jgi:hypothetical protein